MSLLLALTAASGNSQSLAVTLDGVAVNASQVAGHSQSIAVTLDGVTVSVSQNVTAFVNTQALSITLDGAVVAASQVLSVGFVDTHDGYWTKRWLALKKKPKIAEVIEFVKEQPQLITEKWRTTHDCKNSLQSNYCKHLKPKKTMRT
jgi:hypothetical protein